MAQYRKDKHQYLADGTTIFEVMMLADQYGNLVGPANPSGMAVDAFGRARVSEPITLFESFHRFQDNGKISVANNAGGTYVFNSNTSTIDCTVSTANGAYVYRESPRTFAYQPGKSLQILQSFVMNPVKTGLRQRYGYFGTNNGFFLERQSSGNTAFVSRSSANGSIVDTPVDQSEWNMDKLDGAGPSGLTLNLDDPQILFTDIEWLGVGTVRQGFVIDGKLIHCHSWHHANKDTGPKGAYMQTACLPVRMEIENVGATASNSTLKVICATVISEGGYNVAGKPRTIYTPITSQYALTTAGTYYPAATIQLKNANKDGIAILTGISLVGLQNASYHWKILKGATVGGNTTFNSAGTDSIIETNLNANTVSGGTELASGFFVSTNQSAAEISLGGGGFFQYQLERNSFANTVTPLTLAVASSAPSSNVYASINWQEIT